MSKPKSVNKNKLTKETISHYLFQVDKFLNLPVLYKRRVAVNLGVLPQGCLEYTLRDLERKTVIYCIRRDYFFEVGFFREFVYQVNKAILENNFNNSMSSINHFSRRSYM